MDIAELGFRARTDDLARGRAELDRFAATGERTGRRVGRSAKVTERAMSNMGRSIGAAAAAFIGFFASREVIRGISEFETSMSSVGAVTRASAADLAAMRDLARDMGATTEFSATQAANGLRFLGMAGFSATESINTLPNVLNLATASGLELAQAADTASNIMSAFSINALGSAKVSDVLAAASSRANTTVGQLGAAMSTVGPVAAALDISLSDTAAAIGVMSDAGIQGERAGTALRGVLASLTGPTDQARDALARYGLTAADVNPATDDLADIMDRLGSVGLSTADAMTIFGREAASGALVLAGASDRLREFSGELTQADGEARRMADTMRDNLGGDIAGLVSAMSGLILTMGEAGLTNALRGATQGVTDLVRGVSGGLEAIGDLTGYVIAAAGALAITYTPAIYGAVTATLGLVTSLVTLRGVLIATGIGALVVGTGFLINKFLELRNELGSTGAMFSALGEIFGLTFRGMVDTLGIFRLAWDAVMAQLELVYLNLMLSVQEGWTSVLRLISSGLSTIPGMESAFERVSLAIIKSETQASLLDAKIFQAEQAAGSFSENASKLLAEAFNPALAKATQLISLISAASSATSGAPDDGLRGGQLPNTPVITTPTIPSVSIPSVGGSGSATQDEFKSRLEQLQQGLMSEREVLDEWHLENLEIITDRRAEELLSEQEHFELKYRLEAEYQARRLELGDRTNKHEVDARRKTVDLVGNLLGALAGKSRVAAIAQIALNKGLAIASTIQNTAAAAVRALAELGPIAGPPAAARIKAFGAAQIGIIAATGLAQAFGGNGSSGGLGGGGSSREPTVAGVTNSPREVRVNIEGGGIFADMLRDSTQQIFDAVFEENDNRGVVFQVARA